MITLCKNPEKDFIILNLTDPQLSNEEWSDGHKNRLILEHTVTELVKRVNPDLITLSGDLAWAGNDFAYDSLANFLESFDIPWAFVWGNHDNQNGADCVQRVVDRYLKLKNCVYEKGDVSLGNGNYVICIEENGKPVEGIILLDSHDKDEFTNESGQVSQVWAKLTKAQIEWYKEQVSALKSMGCKESIMLLHIPIFAYYQACNLAYKGGVGIGLAPKYQAVSTADWNAGFADSVGFTYEGISCYPEDDGVFDAVLACGHTKHVIAGHDHVNNFIINYKGVKLVYGLKAGAGCYWREEMNGGTVFTIGTDGVKSVRHEYVDVSYIK